MPSPRCRRNSSRRWEGIYQKFGKLEQADRLLESALAKREALYGPDSPETAKGLLALGITARRRSEV